jgi:hypothetical protein
MYLRNRIRDITVLVSNLYNAGKSGKLRPSTLQTISHILYTQPGYISTSGVL